MPPHNPENLERLVHRVLRDLPDRPAPMTLEFRVLAEIERRASLPWWRLSYSHWPVPARVAFVLSAFAVAVLVSGWMHVLDEAERHFDWITCVRALWQTFSESTSAVLDAIPLPWLYGTLAVFVACYAALAGMGAAAYRTRFSRHRAFQRLDP